MGLASLTVHKDLPERTTLRLAGWIDERYQLANLIADEAGNYFSDDKKKVLMVDRKTGEMKPTPYVGTIECFVDGNLAISLGGTPPLKLYGKYGEALKQWQIGAPGTPSPIYLEKYSCTLQSVEPMRHRKDGSIASGRRLRPEQWKTADFARRPTASQCEGRATRSADLDAKAFHAEHADSRCYRAVVPHEA